MTDILFLLIGAVLVNSFVLAQRPAVHPFKGAAGKLHTACALAAAASLVLIAVSVVTYFVYHYLLLPFDLAFLRTVTYILVIAIMANLGAIMIRKAAPTLSGLPDIFMPLLATNAAVLGVALINDIKANSFAESALFGLGAAVGFSLLLVLFSTLSERLPFAEVPKPFQGAGIALVTAGLISLALMGFTGLV